MSKVLGSHLHRTTGLNAKHVILTATFQLNFESRAIDSTCVAPTKEQSSFIEVRREALRSFTAEAMAKSKETAVPRNLPALLCPLSCPLER